MKPSFWLPAFAICALIAPESRAAVLSGTLTVPPAPPAEHYMNAYPGRANAMASHRMAARGAVHDAVLWIESIPAATDSALAQASRARPKLAQLEQRFMPRVVSVAVGGKVDFPNQDPIYHNVFSVSSTRRFDLGKFSKGQSRSVTFPKPGLVNVYCDIHSDMAAFIVVTPNHSFTQPDADGSYALADLPAGKYTLHVWHPDFGSFEREVDLSGDLTLALSY